MVKAERAHRPRHKSHPRWRWRVFEGAVRDARLACLNLARSPGHTLSTVATLSVGIGATTALFAVVGAVLLRPLPFPDSHRIVHAFQHRPSSSAAGTFRTSSFTIQQFEEWRATARTLSPMAFHGMRVAAISRDGSAVRMWGSLVSTDFFQVMAVPPLLGRTFVGDGNQIEREAVIVLSHGAWASHYGSDPAIVGDTIRVDGRGHEVLGIMPAGFDYPSVLPSYRLGSGRREDGSQFWIPLPRAVAGAAGRALSGSIVARLGSGIGLDQASAEARVILADWASDAEVRPELVPLYDEVTAPVRPALSILFGAGLVVLTAAATNVVGLGLARAERRRRGVDIRRALGANRGELVRYELTESLMIAAAAGLAGWAIATAATRAVGTLASGVLPQIGEFRVDGAVLLLVVIATGMCGLLCGLGAALYGGLMRETLSYPGGRAVCVPARKGTGVFRAIATTEVFLATVLLVAAMLMLASLVRLTRVEPGFDPSGVLTLSVPLPESRYATDIQRRAVAVQIAEAFGRLGPVEQVGLADSMPFQTLSIACCFAIDGRQSSPAPTAASRFVAPGYFRTLRIQVVRGRSFVESDWRAQPPVAIISEAFAEQYLVGVDPLGVELEFGTAGPIRIVGVVASARHRLNRPAPPELFRPYGVSGGVGLGATAPTYGLRLNGDPMSALPFAARAVAEIDAGLAIDDVATLEQRMDDSIARSRLLAFVLAGFGAVAVSLAAAGVGGVLVYTVNRRTREIGVRIAVGARSGAIMRMVYAEGLGLAGGGLVTGLAVAWVITGYMEGLLWNTSPREPLVFATVALLLTIVACAACYAAARRAVGVTGLEALRSE